MDIISIVRHSTFRGELGRGRRRSRSIIFLRAAVLIGALSLLLSGTGDSPFRRGGPMIGQSPVTALELASAADGPPVCLDVALRLNDDYSWAVGSARIVGGDDALGEGSRYAWLRNGQEVAAGEIGELLHLSLDDTAMASGGEMPLAASGLTFVAGRWGQAVKLEDGAALTYRRAGNLDLAEGTVEFWLALVADGDDSRYVERSHVLFAYQAANGETFGVYQAGSTGVVYAGGTVGGEWQSAYSSHASMRAWRAGEWHHVAVTYSVTEQFIRFYLDGRLLADTNERRYRAAEASADRFSVGGDGRGKAAAYLIDELRILARPLPSEEVALRARRLEAPQPNEVWLPASGLGRGDEVLFVVTPIRGGVSGTSCASAPRRFPGTVLFDPRPPSTLLPPGTTSMEFEVKSVEPDRCAYSLGTPLPYSAMTPMNEEGATTLHRATIQGLSTDPNTVNELYVRCASEPEFVLHQRYRVLSAVRPSYPRTGNLWGSWTFLQKPVTELARIDLWLGAGFTADQIRALRRANPQVRVLTSINAVEHPGLPDDYYLKDVNGKRVEVWPGSFRLNITKPYVAEHQARLAYQYILDSDLMYDGIFFDNVMTTQSWQTKDIYGNPFIVDANEDGLADDPHEFDAAWREGLFRELRLFRQLIPHGIVSGHANIYDREIGDIFNGASIGFFTADVIEGRRSFADLHAYYDAWLSRPRQPEATMIESSPPDQLAYGYGYVPWRDAPAATIEFGRTFYPYMRFGLAFTLLGDGYFAHEWGDTWHGNDWWYDELDFDLGMPIGKASQVVLADHDPGPNLVTNGSFEEPLAGSWRLWANRETGCEASARLDATLPVTGELAARIDITRTSGVEWHIDFAQFNRHLVEDVDYELTFWARADRPRPLGVASQKGSPDWRNYGLYRQLALGPEWREYRVPFTATETASDARLQFFVGAITGTVWLDDVRLARRAPDVYQRPFEHGLVVLNASREWQEVSVGPGYARLEGRQAPRVDRILDDEGDHFATRGDWQRAEYDSGEWVAQPPYFHDWGAGCHELRPGQAGMAEWRLPIDVRDVYTVTAWWPAAPEAVSWTKAALFELVQDGRPLARTVVDQSQGGDQWHVIAVAELAPGSADSESAPSVRLWCDGFAPCIADALHLRSAARYNDGRAVTTVRLAPMDGIVLRRVTAAPLSLPLVLANHRRGDEPRFHRSP